jgi:hypothetical protein
MKYFRITIIQYVKFIRMYYVGKYRPPIKMGLDRLIQEFLKSFW